MNRLIYKCRACAGSMTLELKPDARFPTMHKHFEYIVRLGADMFFPHKCKPGQVGLADLIGIREHVE